MHHESHFYVQGTVVRLSWVRSQLQIIALWITFCGQGKFWDLVTSSAFFHSKYIRVNRCQLERVSKFQLHHEKNTVPSSTSRTFQTRILPYYQHLRSGAWPIKYSNVHASMDTAISRIPYRWQWSQEANVMLYEQLNCKRWCEVGAKMKVWRVIRRETEAPLSSRIHHVPLLQPQYLITPMRPHTAFLHCNPTSCSFNWGLNSARKYPTSHQSPCSGQLERRRVLWMESTWYL